MTIVQSVVNTISMIILIPLWIMNFMAAFFSGCLGKVNGCFGWIMGMIGKWAINILAWIVSSIVLILWLIVVMFFSRKREYAADALAAKLADPDSMIHALRTLGTGIVVTPIEKRAFATLKINDNPAWLELFSTHPTIEARIMRLQQVGV
jgi:heat shock protein HtpX